MADGVPPVGGPVKPARGGLGRFLRRDADRRMTRPAGLAYWLDDQPPLLASIGLAAQQIAVVSGNFVMPVAVAAVISADPQDATRFLCLSILAVALWQALQTLPRGPIGSGYPIPATISAATLGAYMLVAQGGGGFGAIAAVGLLVGLGATALTFVMLRPRLLLPNEVAGVVVTLIGVTMVSLATQQMGLLAPATRPGPAAIVVVLATLAAIGGIALSRSAAAPFAVLLGGMLGIGLCFAFGLQRADAAEVLGQTPWFALPKPIAPDFGALGAAPALSALLALVAVKATNAGGLLMVQRASDAGWTRADAPPIRRGLLANGIAMTAAGMIGGAAPTASTSGLGLSIATRTLALRVVRLGVPLLLLLAFSPKLAVLFVLLPDPVKAAMLLYLAGFIMAQGCVLVTVRLLDTRRSLVVAFGLAAGLVAFAAPDAFLAELPALASPLAFGALVAFLANLVTLPLVTQRAEKAVPLDDGAGRAVSEWVAQVAGGWALKPQTARSAERALVDLAELLQARGLATLSLAARQEEDRVEFTLTWQGSPLPPRARALDPEDLFGDRETQERFLVAMATREAQAFSQRTTPRGCEARLAFDD